MSHVCCKCIIWCICSMCCICCIRSTCCTITLVVKKKSTSTSIFQLRKLPPDLVGRVNAYVELLGVDRETFFEELLDALTKEMTPVQERVRKNHEAKKAKLRAE